MSKPVFWYLMFKGNLANQAYFYSTLSIENTIHGEILER